MSSAGSLAVSLSSNVYVLSSGRDIEVEDLPDWLQAENGANESGEPSTLEELEGQFIRDVLARNSWNRTAAARELGIHKTTLHRKIRRLGLELPKIDGRSTRGKARG